MTREMICIVCPMGCHMEVTLENGQVADVKGNTCPRGKKYAESECTAPMRTVTTTVMCENGALLPVRTDRPVRKEDMFKVMEIVNSHIAPLPVKIKDVIIKDVCGANIVAAKNID